MAPTTARGRTIHDEALSRWTGACPSPWWRSIQRYGGRAHRTELPMVVEMVARWAQWFGRGGKRVRCSRRGSLVAPPRECTFRALGSLRASKAAQSLRPSWGRGLGLARRLMHFALSREAEIGERVWRGWLKRSAHKVMSRHVIAARARRESPCSSMALAVSPIWRSRGERIRARERDWHHDSLGRRRNTSRDAGERRLPRSTAVWSARVAQRARLWRSAPVDPSVIAARVAPVGRHLRASAARGASRLGIRSLPSPRLLDASDRGQSLLSHRRQGRAIGDRRQRSRGSLEDVTTGPVSNDSRIDDAMCRARLGRGRGCLHGAVAAAAAARVAGGSCRTGGRHSAAPMPLRPRHRRRASGLRERVAITPGDHTTPR